ncbi:MAG: alpha-L-fucosidase, partial [Planctomycetota bacterium]
LQRDQLGLRAERPAAPDSYNVRGILNMLRVARAGAGNLLLNIGPTPDGSVPAEAVEPLQQVGKWLERNGEAVYGPAERGQHRCCGWGDTTMHGNKVYLWTKIWPEGDAGIGGFMTPLKSARIVGSDTSLDFEQADQRIVLKNLPQPCPDEIAGRAVIELTFAEPPQHARCSKVPALHGGHAY